MFFKKTISLEQAIEHYADSTINALNELVRHALRNDTNIPKIFTSCGGSVVSVQLNNPQDFHYHVLNYWVFTQTREVSPRDRKRLYRAIEDKLIPMSRFILDVSDSVGLIDTHMFFDEESLSAEDQERRSEITAQYRKVFESDDRKGIDNATAKARGYTLGCLEYDYHDAVYQKTQEVFEKIYLEKTFNKASWKQVFKGYRIT